MKKVNTKKKSSAKMKLIPAAGSLMISAAMLSTSTYAWFTMSKEVEVTGIKMTAVVPEDLQISLGDEDSTGTKLVTTNNDDGVFTDDVAYSANTQIYSATVKAPTVSDNTNDWHNTVDFSRFYTAARLNPASSTDGNFLFKTADATSQGETVSDTAAFSLVTVPEAADKKDMAGLYVNYDSTVAGAPDLNLKANSGYYVDFPVWFRTSSYTADVTGLTDGSTPTVLKLGVKATITQNTGTEAKEDLYHAVRIAVLPASGTWNATTGAATNATYTGVIHDNYVVGKTSKYYDRYQAANSELADGAVVRQALKAPGTLAYDSSTDKQTNAGSLYGATDVVIQASTKDATTGFYSDGEAVVDVPLSTSQNAFGTPVKYIIRVWLEGEDQFCWNPTAGQDFNVSLQFVKLTNVAGDHAVPADMAAGLGASSVDTVPTGAAAVSNPANIAIKINGVAIASGTYSTSSHEFTTAVTNILDDTHTVAESGTGDKTYQLADGTRIGNSTDLKNYIEAHLNEYDFTNGIDLIQIIPAP
jgi:hypothetical protein